jgi:omega-amidase
MISSLNRNFIHLRSIIYKVPTKRRIETMATVPLKFKMALCQINVGSDKEVNISHAASIIDHTTTAELVVMIRFLKLCYYKSKNNNTLMSPNNQVLPECWNSPYSTASFPKYAEAVPVVGQVPDATDSPSVHMMCNAARTKNIWIIGGSVPERDGEKLYNTCVVINSSGEIVGKHRKVHLFDIDVPGKITFKESDSLSPGNSPTIVDTPWGKIGVGICYDIRFPEYAMMLRQMGARMLVYPGAFNMVTGPAHWELLQRARAVDNQLFVVACSPARDQSPTACYTAWGHSTVVSPWGEVVVTTEHEEAVLFADIELEKVDTMRQGIPCWTQKRSDMYKLETFTN